MTANSDSTQLHNWRGPVWMPVNFLLYVALLCLYAYYGDEFTIECAEMTG